MRPYTRAGDGDEEERYRKNWRGNKNYRRKAADRVEKKRYRRKLDEEMRQWQRSS